MLGLQVFATQLGLCSAEDQSQDFACWMSEHSTKGDASPAPHCQKNEYQFKVPKGQEDEGVFAAERIVSTIEAKTKNVNFERLITWHSLIKFIYKSFVECLLCASLGTQQ